MRLVKVAIHETIESVTIAAKIRKRTTDGGIKWPPPMVVPVAPGR